MTLTPLIYLKIVTKSGNAKADDKAEGENAEADDKEDSDDDSSGPEPEVSVTYLGDPEWTNLFVRWLAPKESSKILHLEPSYQNP